MEALARSSTCRHTTLHVSSARRSELLDLTDRLESIVAATGAQAGTLNVQTLDTTTGLVVNEHEPRLLSDLATLIHGVAPGRASLLPSSVILTVAGGRLLLGQRQRVFLIALDGPRTHIISVLSFGEAA
jgi:thiamine phosphate synthase YjbQ (UPF0047 family)